MTTPTDLNSTANDAAALPDTFNAGELTLIAGAAFSLSIAPAPLVVTFCVIDGTRAQLTVNKGRVTFEGDPNAGAEIFIEAVTRKHAQQWGAQQARLETAEAQLKAYSHHNGLMMLSQRLVDVEKERDALREQVNQVQCNS